ncbi:MAG TPA: hypothetical protein VIY48_05905 [Candidatus Paceibacterota bacterium]
MHQHFLRDEELQYRRSLFNAAAKGDIFAQQELEREYRVWVFSKQRKNKPRHTAEVMLQQV